LVDIGYIIIAISQTIGYIIIAISQTKHGSGEWSR